MHSGSNNDTAVPYSVDRHIIYFRHHYLYLLSFCYLAIASLFCYACRYDCVYST